jgi:hypothetical protein
MIPIVFLFRAGRCVVERTVGDPLGDQQDFLLRQRISFLRHLRFTIDGGDLFDQEALLRVPRKDRPFLALAALEQSVEVRHDVTALVLRRLMAAMAFFLKDRAHVAIEADRLGALLG